MRGTVYFACHVMGCVGNLAYIGPYEEDEARYMRLLRLDDMAYRLNGTRSYYEAVGWSDAFWIYEAPEDE